LGLISEFDVVGLIRFRSIWFDSKVGSFRLVHPRKASEPIISTGDGISIRQSDVHPPKNAVLVPDSETSWEQSRIGEQTSLDSINACGNQIRVSL
jgi:hypothetical protein